MGVWFLKSKITESESSIVLSVAAGQTIHLIEKCFVHAHPISNGYNYTPTKYITFRQANGGVMNKIYNIDRTFPIEMKSWERDINQFDIPENIKKELTMYITSRYKDFDFDKAPKYKFYLLRLLCELPNNPHPPSNNAGGWYYNLNDLKESTGVVNTIKKSK